MSEIIAVLFSVVELIGVVILYVGIAQAYLLIRGD